MTELWRVEWRSRAGYPRSAMYWNRGGGRPTMKCGHMARASTLSI